MIDHLKCPPQYVNHSFSYEPPCSTVERSTYRASVVGCRVTWWVPWLRGTDSGCSHVWQPSAQSDPTMEMFIILLYFI